MNGMGKTSEYNRACPNELIFANGIDAMVTRFVLDERVVEVFRAEDE